MLVTSNFSFFHCVFKRLILMSLKNQGLFGKGLTWYLTIRGFNDPKRKKSFKQFAKRRKCWQPSFSPFPRLLFTLQRKKFSFETRLFNRMEMFSIWTGLKFCRLVKSLKWTALWAFFKSLAKSNQDCEDKNFAS